MAINFLFALPSQTPPKRFHIYVHVCVCVYECVFVYHSKLVETKEQLSEVSSLLPYWSQGLDWVVRLSRYLYQLSCLWPGISVLAVEIGHWLLCI